MDNEDAIMKAFLTGPLTWDEAMHRLEGLGYLREDAYDLVTEWADDAEAHLTQD